MDNYTTLKKLINCKETLVVPDAYDAISAKIIEKLGFKSVQCSGYSIALSKGLKDENLLTLKQNLDTTEIITESVTIPVFADGEDGYGNGKTFEENIKKFIKTGISAINIEDQNLWNVNSREHLHPISECIEKIKYIKRNYPELVVNARTDAINTYDERANGIKEAIERANIYYESGADLCFPTGVTTRDEIKLLNTEIIAPLSIAAGLPYNLNNFNIRDCQELEVARVSLPTIMIFSSVNSQVEALKKIQETGLFNNEAASDIDPEFL